jgi:hypothetical protein
MKYVPKNHIRHVIVVDTVCVYCAVRTKYLCYLNKLLEDLGVYGNNIKMDLQDVGWGGMGWIDLTQDRDRLYMPSCCTKCREFLY